MLDFTSDPYRTLAPVYDSLGLSGESEAYIKKVLEAMDKLPSGAKSLDLGCGTGKVSILLSLSGWSAEGVDISSEMIAMARLQALEAQALVDFKKQDLRAIDIKEKFDLVTCFRTLNHLNEEEEIEASIRAISRSLKRGGFFACDFFFPRAFPQEFTRVLMSPGVYLIEKGSPKKEDLLERFCIIFKKKGELFEKKECSILERGYSKDFLLKTAQNHGLKLIKTWGIKEGKFLEEEEKYNLFLFRRD
ncbi:MAG: class I SAM-dependent methyltransferase [Caldiserica bacterium]|jgi:ubiquinone/menaquinone biosynthesis C-methylase UbiE|nr:class I SAM-dependent methyltransferase [Caldisericota bacterium]MDH7561787.1 class I SAM-dependent methyltransferase [Caldisericota bacterium]